MSFSELNRKAKDIAIKNLERGFDWQAFLVLSVAILNEERIGKPVDIVPESNVDECIQKLLELFKIYMNDRNINNYSNLLTTLRQILSELYHTTEDEKQKQEFKNFIKLCDNITK